MADRPANQAERAGIMAVVARMGSFDPGPAACNRPIIRVSTWDPDFATWRAKDWKTGPCAKYGGGADGLNFFRKSFGSWLFLDPVPGGSALRELHPGRLVRGPRRLPRLPGRAEEGDVLHGERPGLRGRRRRRRELQGPAGPQGVSTRPTTAGSRTSGSAGCRSLRARPSHSSSRRSCRASDASTGQARTICRGRIDRSEVVPLRQLRGRRARLRQQDDRPGVVGARSRPPVLSLARDAVGDGALL